MTEETNLRNWGWGLLNEPSPTPQETREHFETRMKDWAVLTIRDQERRIWELIEKERDIRAKNTLIEQEVKDGLQKIEVYKKILANQKGTFIHEPGTVVELPSLGVKGKILTVTIYPGGECHVHGGIPQKRRLLPLAPARQRGHRRNPVGPPKPVK